ncbi:hypothetical protein EVAR_31989_1 [Eumeta japonica]|uniref:Uncharacterized protein n=1 Tax=Eumeta variegata TaxID=151549 RepID=A0A4C1VSK6_EUMVA|nr:hypothetical protein EVAR_31989_1 [Eumeta japonica]
MRSSSLGFLFPFTARRKLKQNRPNLSVQVQREKNPKDEGKQRSLKRVKPVYKFKTSASDQKVLDSILNTGELTDGFLVQIDGSAHAVSRRARLSRRPQTPPARRRRQSFNSSRSVPGQQGRLEVQASRFKMKTLWEGIA